MRSKHLFYFIIILILGCLLYSLNYIKRFTRISCSFTFWLGLTFGVDLFIFKFSEFESELQKNFTTLLVIGGLLLSGFSLNYNYSANNNSANYVIEDITINTLNEIEPNSVLMTYDWGYVYPAAVYYQQVAKVRQDVKLFNVKFLRFMVPEHDKSIIPMCIAAARRNRRVHYSEGMKNARLSWRLWLGIYHEELQSFHIWRSISLTAKK
jgi:hypothetical protein